MDSGAFEVLQIGYDVDRNELYRVTGSLELSLHWKHSERIVAGSIGLNVIVTVLSIYAFIAVVRRRFELFSSTSLFLISLTSLAMSALQLRSVLLLQQNAFYLETPHSAKIFRD